MRSSRRICNILALQPRSMWSGWWHGSMEMNWLQHGSLPSRGCTMRLKEVSQQCLKCVRAVLFVNQQFLARLALSYDPGHSSPSLPGSMATVPEPERGGSCAPRPRIPCLLPVRSPTWTRTPASHSASLRCACSCRSSCPSPRWICLRRWL